MKLLSSTNKVKLFLFFIIMILPFLLLYWMAPFVTDLTLGKDYQEYSIQNQMEILFSIKTGSFPLYVPGYALGHSSSALTLGQIFHPISHIVSILPGYWSGKALQWNTFFRLISLGLVHLVLFTFLQRIGLNILFSFLLSCITVYNLRMLDLFRFGASLEAYTGYLFLCTAIGWYFLKPTKYLGPLSIIGATYWLVCSGHPPTMYYGLVGAGLFLIVIPFFLSNILLNREINYRDTLIFWIKTGFYIVLGILLSSAYILPFYFDFIGTNTLRVAQNYEFTLTSETFFGTLSNFFMPFFSEVHGAFGGSSLFLMAAILPVLRCFKIRIPRPIWIIWGLTLFVFLYMQGDRTPIYRWAWKYLPFVSSMRGEGRISLIIPVFIMMLLAWIVNNTESFSFRLKVLSISLTPYMLLALISLLLIPLYIFWVFTGRELSNFSSYYIRSIPLWIVVGVILSGGISLVLMYLYGAYPRAASVVGISLCLATCIQIGSILKYGTFIAERHDQPTFEQIKSQKRVKLDYLYNPGSGMYSSVVLNHLNHSFLEPFLGKIYTEVIPVSDQDEAYKRMERERLPQQIFIEGIDPEITKKINEGAREMKKGRVKLVYSSFNRLQFHVISEAPAFFGFSYPYTGHWCARVNGQKTRVYRANGSAHAVEIPGGESLVEFRYWSTAAFWGVCISSTVFILIGLYVCLSSLNGLSRLIGAVFVLIIGVGIIILWNHSLYTGDNLGTEYIWTYSPPEIKPNLAYGKKVSRSHQPADSYYYASRFFRTHRSKMVDGNKSKGSGYLIRLTENPVSIIVDLYDRKKINSIVFYITMKEPVMDSWNLNLFISQDRKQWNRVTSVMSKAGDLHPIRIEFDSPEIARYIQIKASGYGILSLDELEVYGP
jgi:hypothetical protein